MESKAADPLLYMQLMLYGNIFPAWPAEGKNKEHQRFLRDLQSICLVEWKYADFK